MSIQLQPFVVRGRKGQSAWQRVINASAAEGARLEAERRGVTVASVVTLAEQQAADEASQRELDRQAELDRSADAARRAAKAAEELEVRRRRDAEARAHWGAAQREINAAAKVVVVHATPESLFWAIFWPVLAAVLLASAVTFFVAWAVADHLLSRVN